MMPARGDLERLRDFSDGAPAGVPRDVWLFFDGYLHEMGARRVKNRMPIVGDNRAHANVRGELENA